MCHILFNVFVLSLCIARNPPSCICVMGGPAMMTTTDLGRGSAIRHQRTSFMYIKRGVRQRAVDFKSTACWMHHENHQRREEHGKMYGGRFKNVGSSQTRLSHPENIYVPPRIANCIVLATYITYALWNVHIICVYVVVCVRCVWVRRCRLYVCERRKYSLENANWDHKITIKWCCCAFAITQSFLS